MTVTYHANVFHGGVLSIGNAAWYHNTFENVCLIVDALPDDFVGNSVKDCQIEFVPGGITPLEFSDWLEPREPGLAAGLRKWVANGGWTPPKLN